MLTTKSFFRWEIIASVNSGVCLGDNVEEVTTEELTLNSYKVELVNWVEQK